MTKEPCVILGSKPLVQWVLFVPVYTTIGRTSSYNIYVFTPEMNIKSRICLAGLCILTAGFVFFSSKLMLHQIQVNTNALDGMHVESNTLPASTSVLSDNLGIYSICSMIK